MGFALLLSLAFMAFMCVPLSSAAFAKRMGRPFWAWFFIGLILPGISVLVLFCLPDLSEKSTEPVSSPAN